MRIQSLLDLKDDFPRIAKEADTTPAYLLQVAYGYSIASPKLALKIDAATQGKVSRHELRQDIFGEAA